MMNRFRIVLMSALATVQACGPSNYWAYAASPRETGQEVMLMKEQAVAPATPSSGKRRVYAKSDGLYQKDSAGTETKVGSGGGGGGGINFIAQGTNWEVTTTDDRDLNNTVGNWAAFKDASGTSPEDLTGGSPTATCTRSATDPLDGTASLVVTFGAADHQGEGCAVPFNVQPAYQGRSVTVSFPTLIASGTIADGDVNVWVYNVTKTTLIQATCSTFGAPTTQCRFTTTAKDPSPVNHAYRLGIYRPVATATALTLKADNFSISPDGAVIGYAGSDWHVEPMVVGVNSGTAPTKGTTAVDIFRWRQIGQDMEFDYRFRQTSAGTAGSGFYVFPLPAGLSIDPALSPSAVPNLNSVVGTAKISNSSTGDAIDSSVGIVFAFDSTHLALAYQNTNGSQSIVGSTLFALDSPNMAYSFTAKFPIAGWSSNVTMASDPAALPTSMNLTGGAPSAAAGAPLIFPTAGSSSGFTYNSTTGEITTLVPGDYDILGYVVGTASQTITLWIDGVEFREVGFIHPDTAGNISAKVTLALGQVVTFRPFSGGGSITLGASSSIGLSRVTGSTSIALDVMPAARYYSSATALTSGNFADIVYTTKDYDTHGAYVSGAYTVPVGSDGRYAITAAVRLTAATTAANQLVRIQILKNGAVVSGPTSAFYASATAKPLSQTISDTLYLKAGDTIKIQASSAGTTPSINASTTANYFSIAKVGN